MPAKSKYDPEFKIRAVKYYKTKKTSLRKAGRSLGVSATTLREWVEAHNNSHEEKSLSISQTIKSHEDYRILKKQLEEVTAERDILKKALMIFSQAKN